MKWVWQVCSLPPAWGYEHCGLERFLLSFPQLSQKDGAAPSRLLKQDDDQALLDTAKRREDRMAFPLAFCKLLKGVGVSCNELYNVYTAYNLTCSSCNGVCTAAHADKFA